MEYDLRRELGEHWIMAAEDLDRAVYEWGQYIEGSIDKRLTAYRKQVDKRNEQRRNQKGGGTPVMESYDPTYMQDEAHSEVLYLVDEIAATFTATIGEDMFDQTGKGVMWKDAVGDRVIDFDMSIGEVHEEWFE